MMLSMDFKRVWQSPASAGAAAGSSAAGSGRGSRLLSIWRPVGPPGYAPLGDVAMPGQEPPAKPVAMYKDVQAAGEGAPQVGSARLALLCATCAWHRQALLDGGRPPVHGLHAPQAASAPLQWLPVWAPQGAACLLTDMHVCPVATAGQAAGQAGRLPPLALPERFQIIYRDSGTGGALSVWRPVAPKG